MSLLQFCVSMLVPLAVVAYTFNFSLWLWRRNDRLGAAGAFALTVLAGGGSVTYLAMKLFWQ